MRASNGGENHSLGSTPRRRCGCAAPAGAGPCRRAGVEVGLPAVQRLDAVGDAGGGETAARKRAPATSSPVVSLVSIWTYCWSSLTSGTCGVVALDPRARSPRPARPVERRDQAVGRPPHQHQAAIQGDPAPRRRRTTGARAVEVMERATATPSRRFRSWLRWYARCPHDLARAPPPLLRRRRRAAPRPPGRSRRPARPPASRYLAVELGRLGGGLGLPLDDSWIHLQFARNLAAGRGLSYNAGELRHRLDRAAVDGAAVAPLPAAGQPARLGAAGSASSLYLAGIDATRRLARELGLRPGAGGAGRRRSPAPLAGLVGAVGHGDPALRAALDVGNGAAPARAGRSAGGRGPAAPLAPAVLALAALARPEGLLLLGARRGRRLPAVRPPRRRARAARGSWRPPFRRAGPRGAAGALRPCRAAAVLSHRRRQLPAHHLRGEGRRAAALAARPASYVARGDRDLSSPAAVHDPARAAAGVSPRGSPRVAPRPRPAAGAMAGGLPLAYSTLSPPGEALLVGNFGRYYFPLFPVLVVLGVVGLERPPASCARE